MGDQDNLNTSINLFMLYRVEGNLALVVAYGMYVEILHRYNDLIFFFIMEVIEKVTRDSKFEV